MVILELIHASKLRPVKGRALLLDQNQSSSAVKGGLVLLVTLNNFGLIAAASRRRRIFQMSALSTFDGT